MGATSSSINSSFSGTKVITDAFIDITQDLSQGLSAFQKLNVDCNSDHTGQNCLNCIEAWKKVSNDPNIAEKVCNSVCVCTAKDIIMDQNIVLNLKIWQEYNNKDEFIKKIKDSISQSANSSGQSLYSIGDRQSNLSNVINNVYDSMKSNTFMESIQSVKNLQVISVESSGELININFSNFTDYFSSILQTNDSTSSLMDQLDIAMIQLTTKVTDAGLARLILWIVRIVIGILMIIVLFYSLQYVFQIYTLYVQK
jgi:hypothetical protein